MLGLPRSNATYTVLSIDNIPIGTTKGQVNLTISSIYNETNHITVSALILPKLTSITTPDIVDAEKWEFLKHIQLADPTFFKPNDISLLIGCDYCFDVLIAGDLKSLQGYPKLQNTIFGYVVTGKGSPPIELQLKTLQINLETNIDETLRKFWEIESLNEKATSYSAEEEYCENHFNENIQISKEGRFVVKLPFKQLTTQLGDSKGAAMARFLTLEQRLIKNDLLYEQYKQFLNEYLELNHMEEVVSKSVELQPNQYCYLPHHGVHKKESTTTRLRVVFDGSAVTSSGVSLNSNLTVGPTIQRNLLNILLNFRMHKIGIIADIEKMYRQVLVHPSDRDYQRILWRNNNHEPIKTYRLCTVTYGTASAPFLATRALKQIALDSAKQYPKAADVILNDFYIDDLLTGADNVQDAIHLAEEVSYLLANRGFYLRKWTSNSKSFLDSRPSTQLPSPNKTLDIYSGISKVLGLNWNTESDSFTFTPTFNMKSALTKRHILSESSRIYDPLGFVAPCTVLLKILYQALWKEKLSWDDPVPNRLGQQWSRLRSEFNTSEEISIPRALLAGTNQIRTFHGFCDASNSAYAAVIYCRSPRRDGSGKVTIVAAKTRVAPIKSISIPRLELCGALLLFKLYNTVKEALRLQTLEFTAWTDSKIVIAWLSSNPSRWKTFVSNRVSEIISSLPRKNWRYVPSNTNPADCASRGLTPHQLSKYKMWWHGPEWLSQQEDQWPVTLPDSTYLTINQESKQPQLLALHVKTENDTLVLLFSRISNLSKIIRVIAFCKRFLTILRRKVNRDSSSAKVDTTPDYISCDERQEALNICIKWAQQDLQENQQCQQRGKLKKKLKSLAPFVDKNGIMRVGGRLHNAGLAYNSRHPALLPKGHPLSIKLIKHYHLKYLHAGPTLLLSIIRLDYWIIGCRNSIRTHVKKCLQCFRNKCNTAQQLMSDLPKARVTPSRPFYHCGVDYAGPLQIKLHKLRGAKTVKAYIATFICFSTKAVHIEAVSDLTTDAFIAALKRFIARRGAPRDIYSDNATNFVGAKRKLSEIYKLILTKEYNNSVSEYLSERMIHWHFIPPSSPHFGGLWESNVKSIKTHMRRVIGDSTLTFEELTTLLAQIEALLNSRPLTPLHDDDPSSIDVLTPSHFLIGEPTISLPDKNYLNQFIPGCRRWELVQKMKQGFWKRWSNEYLTTLQHRQKWTSKQPNLVIGDIVLVREDNLPPASWRLGRIISTHPGADGLVRVATVKTPQGTYKRPIVKLARLPLD